MHMTLEAYASEVASLVVGIGTGIVIRARFWWGSKTKEQKLNLISDAMSAFEDGKVTTDEAISLIKTHL